MTIRHRSAVFSIIAAVLLLAFQGVHSTDADRCGIRCIFKGETAELPTHAYDVPAEAGGEVLYQVKIYGGSCAHFDLVGNSSTTYLNLSAYEVRHETTFISTTECSTSYDILSAATGEAIETGGYATFSLDIPSILTGMRVVPDPEDGVPTSVELTQCASPDARFALTSADKREDLVRAALEAAGTAGDAACRTIRGLMGRISAKFAEWAPTIRAGKEAPAAPKPYTPASPEEAADLCDLSKSAVLNVARYAVNDVIGADGMEALMDAVTNGTGHAWANMSSDVLAGIIGGYLMFITSDVMYSFPEGDFYNLSEWDDVRTALPAPNGDNYSFYTRIKMPAMDAHAQWLGENYIRNRMWEDLGLNDERGSLRIGFAEPAADVWAQLLVNATRLRQLTPPMLLEPGCLIGALKTFKLTALTLNASAVTDWGFRFESGDFEAEFQDSLNSFSAVLAEAYAPHQVGIINGFYVKSHLQSLNMVIAQALGNEWPCEELPAYQEPPVVNFLALWITLGLTIFLWVVLLIVAEVLRHTGVCADQNASAASEAEATVYAVDDGTTPPPSEETRLTNPAGTPGVSPVYTAGSYVGDDDGVPEAAKKQQRACCAPSLLMTQRLSPVLRYVIPLLIFVNVSMFITSNASISASVFPSIVFGDFPVEVGSLFDFGLGNTIRDMWSAGVYPLAVLIAFFSGAWPYIKLILMFASWVLPPKVLPLRPRETILRVVDALGKWSLIDSYVMTLMIVAFRYHIVFPVADPADPNGPPPSYVDVVVDARVGFVLFVLATMLSLVLGHVILAVHRATESAPAGGAEAGQEKRAAGGNVNAEVATYGGEDAGDDSLARANIALRSVAFKGKKENVFMQVLITALLVVSVVLVCFGISIQSLAYDVRGLVGWLFELMDIQRRTEYSLVETGAHVLSSTANPSSFTAVLIVVIFFATAVVFPLLHLIVLIFIWLAPLTLKAQRRIFVLAEVLNAWSALDVYVVSCLAALLQLRQFALWIVGDSCDFINPFIEKHLGSVVPGDPVCFDLVAKLDSGSWVLLAACIIYDAVSIVVMNKCHKALETRKAKRNEEEVL